MIVDDEMKKIDRRLDEMFKRLDAVEQRHKPVPATIIRLPAPRDAFAQVLEKLSKAGIGEPKPLDEIAHAVENLPPTGE